MVFEEKPRHGQDCEDWEVDGKQAGCVKSDKCNWRRQKYEVTYIKNDKVLGGYVERCSGVLLDA